MDEPTVYFRRRQFYGDYNTSPPKWHISVSSRPIGYGQIYALCGYNYRNRSGDLISSTETPPRPKGELCAKCARKHTDQAAPEPTQEENLMEQYIKDSTAAIREELAIGRDSGRTIGGAFGQVCADFTYDKDAEDVYDHLLELVIQVTVAINYTVADMMERVETGRLAAHAKHGDNSIEAKPGDETLFWLSCLGEEYGEMCDEGANLPHSAAAGLPRFVEEGIDLCTVAVAWLAALARLGD